MEFLIPHTFYTDSGTWLLGLVLFGGIAVLVKGADWLVDGAVGLAERAGMPKIIIGATVVSLGTTSAEAAVSVVAAFQGVPDLALGNAVGSIICDTGLIFGLSCLLARIPADKFVLQRHGWVQLAVGVLLVLIAGVAVDGVTGAHIVPRWAGFLLLGLLMAYLVASVFWARGHGDESRPADIVHGDSGGGGKERSLVFEAAVLLTGLAMVLVSSHVVVESATEISLRWNVPKAVVAATLIAFGTSLPELVTALACIRKGHPEMLLGNILGADVLNVLFVVGSAASVSQLEVAPVFFKLHFPAMLACLVIFRIMAWTSKGTFSRRPAVLLLAVFAAYIAGNLYFGLGAH